MTIIKGDLFETRDAARALAALLRKRGWDASVEQSGPEGEREWRVLIRHSSPALVAYFHEGDHVDRFVPCWVGGAR
jgi:hypothetical protein